MLSPYFGQPLKKRQVKALFLNALGSHPLLSIVKTKKQSLRLLFRLLGGDKGIRTPDLYDANVSLYQLSHIPKHHCIIKHRRGECKRFLKIIAFHAGMGGEAKGRVLRQVTISYTRGVTGGFSSVTEKQARSAPRKSAVAGLSSKRKARESPMRTGSPTLTRTNMPYAP